MDFQPEPLGAAQTPRHVLHGGYGDSPAKNPKNENRLAPTP